MRAVNLASGQGRVARKSRQRHRKTRNRRLGGDRAPHAAPPLHLPFAGKSEWAVGLPVDRP
jgi:hypothetical protein